MDLSSLQERSGRPGDTSSQDEVGGPGSFVNQNENPAFPNYAPAANSLGGNGVGDNDDGIDDSFVHQDDDGDDDFKYLIDNSHAVAQNLQRILFQEEFADVVLLCQGTEEPFENSQASFNQEDEEEEKKEEGFLPLKPASVKIYAHRQILAASSEVFQTMLYGPFAEGSSREIQIPNISADIMKMLIQFVYTGCVQLESASVIVPLIQAADQYSISGAKEEFAKAAQIFIQKASKKQIKHVIKLIHDALKVDLPQIAKLGFEYIDMHTLEVFESESIFSVDKDLMSSILSRDSLHDGLEEIQLYLACLRWARGYGTLDYTDERQFKLRLEDLSELAQENLKDVLREIRFPLIPAEILVKKIHPQNLIDAEDLFIATAFQAAPDCFKMDKSFKFRHRSGTEVPWDWSTDLSGPHIILSNKSAQGCHYDWEKVVSSTTWRSGTHKYEVQIDLNMWASSNSWQIIVGVAQLQPGLSADQVKSVFNLSNHLGASPKEWGMMCLSGQKIHKNIIENYATSSRRGDIIGVIVDLNTGRLEFTRNGISLGIAYENVKGPISPCVSLLKGQKITLIDSQSKQVKLPQEADGINEIPSQASQILSNNDFEGGDPAVMGQMSRRQFPVASPHNQSMRQVEPQILPTNVSPVEFPNSSNSSQFDHFIEYDRQTGLPQGISRFAQNNKQHHPRMPNRSQIVMQMRPSSLGNVEPPQIHPPASQVERLPEIEISRRINDIVEGRPRLSQRNQLAFDRIESENLSKEEEDPALLINQVVQQQVIGGGDAEVDEEEQNREHPMAAEVGSNSDLQEDQQSQGSIDPEESQGDESRGRHQQPAREDRHHLYISPPRRAENQIQDRQIRHRDASEADDQTVSLEQKNQVVIGLTNKVFGEVEGPGMNLEIESPLLSNKREEEDGEEAKKSDNILIIQNNLEQKRKRAAHRLEEQKLNSTKAVASMASMKTMKKFKAQNAALKGIANSAQVSDHGENSSGNKVRHLHVPSDVYSSSSVDKIQEIGQKIQSQNYMQMKGAKKKSKQLGARDLCGSDEQLKQLQNHTERRKQPPARQSSGGSSIDDDHLDKDQIISIRDSNVIMKDGRNLGLSDRPAKESTAHLSQIQIKNSEHSIRESEFSIGGALPNQMKNKSRPQKRDMPLGVTNLKNKFTKVKKKKANRKVSPVEIASNNMQHHTQVQFFSNLQIDDQANQSVRGQPRLRLQSGIHDNNTYCVTEADQAEFDQNMTLSVSQQIHRQSVLNQQSDYERSDSIKILDSNVNVISVHDEANDYDESTLSQRVQPTLQQIIGQPVQGVNQIASATAASKSPTIFNFSGLKKQKGPQLPQSSSIGIQGLSSANFGVPILTGSTNIPPTIPAAQKKDESIRNSPTKTLPQVQVQSQEYDDFDDDDEDQV